MSNWFAANIVVFEGTITVFLLALGLQFPMRMGVVSFAAVGFYGIGAYTTGSCITRQGWDTAPAILMGVVVAGVVASVLGLVVRRLSGLYLAMTTIAFDLIVVVLAGKLTSITGGLTGMYGVVGDLEFWHLLVIVGFVIAAFACTERGRLSRRIDVIHDDTQLASSFGVNVNRYRLLAFSVSGLIAGLGGSLLVILRTTVTPEAFNFHLIVLALTVIVVGGTRSWAGALIGAIIFMWLPVLLAFAGRWRDVIYGLLVVVAAIYLPGGVWSVIVTMTKAVGRRRRRSAPTRSGSAHGDEAKPLDDLDALGSKNA